MDYDKLKKELEEFNTWTAEYDLNENVINMYGHATDMVNNPAHYTRGNTEVIDIIEDAIQDAPAPAEGLLQGQVLKYILRLWLKGNPLQDAKKAQWYLERLISKLED
mgnify:CR=1 FL=1